MNMEVKDHLEDLQDSLIGGIENCAKLIGQQKELIHIVKKEKTVNDFTSFVKGLEQSTKEYEKQLEGLNKKLDSLHAIMEMYNSGDEKLIKCIDILYKLLVFKEA